MTDPWTAARTDEITFITFPQPGVLLNMNHRHHWRAQRRIAAQWRQAAAHAALLLGSPSQRAHGPSFVEVELPVPDRRPRDPHNLFPVVKHVIDGIVDSGVFPNDTPEWVTTIEPHLVVDRPPKGYAATVRIIIRPRTGLTP